MLDDYQYSDQQINPKSTWPNSLGSETSTEISGLTGKSGTLYSTGSGPNTGSPSVGNTGGGGGGGGGIGLPAGVLGNMLYHNGEKWIVFNKPNTGGILSMDSGIPSWITTNRNGSLLYYFADLKTWVPLPAPLGTNTYVLAFKNGQLEWVQTTDCDEPEQ